MQIIMSLVSIFHARISGWVDKISGKKWKKFDKIRCLKKFNDTDWSSIMSETNVELANSLLEEKIRLIIDSEAPMSTVQLRTRYNRWISDNTNSPW